MAEEESVALNAALTILEEAIAAKLNTHPDMAHTRELHAVRSQLYKQLLQAAPSFWVVSYCDDSTAPVQGMFEACISPFFAVVEAESGLPLVTPFVADDTEVTGLMHRHGRTRRHTCKLRNVTSSAAEARRSLFDRMHASSD